jgi:hypothetical protein
MKHLALSTTLIFVVACSAAPTRVDTIPDPRLSPEYKEFLSHGHPDLPIYAQIHFKSGRPRIFDTLNLSAGTGAPYFSDLDLFLVLILHAPRERIAVTGYTDKLECPPADCVRLSQRRANMIYKLLLAKGVPRNRLSDPAGYGNLKPISSGETEEDRQRERRVDIDISKE